ncbi:hypothetical protein, partial [Bacteroides uniformis]
KILSNFLLLRYLKKIFYNSVAELRIEMNLTAESGFAQMNGGPLFGKYLDEVMERVSKVHKDYRNSVEMKFENGSRLMMKV